MRIELSPIQEAALLAWAARHTRADGVSQCDSSGYELCLSVGSLGAQACARRGNDVLDLGEVAVHVPIQQPTQGVGPKAAKFIEMLKRFNAKERNFLMRYALCPDRTPALSSTFLREVLTRLGQIGVAGIEESRPAYFGMDYHLEWIQAALVLADGRDLAEIHKEAKQARIEDVDLLLVLRRTDASLVMVLIEAKGASYFGNGQLKRKVARFKALRTALGVDSEWITSVMLLMSPAEFAPSPKTLAAMAESLQLSEIGFWPATATSSLLWMPLVGFFDDLAHPGQALRIRTCYEEGRQAKNISARDQHPYTHWRVQPRFALAKQSSFQMPE